MFCSFLQKTEAAGLPAVNIEKRLAINVFDHGTIKSLNLLK